MKTVSNGAITDDPCEDGQCHWKVDSFTAYPWVVCGVKSREHRFMKVLILTRFETACALSQRCERSVAALLNPFKSLGQTCVLGEL